MRDSAFTGGLARRAPQSNHSGIYDFCGILTGLLFKTNETHICTKGTQCDQLGLSNSGFATMSGKGHL